MFNSSHHGIISDGYWLGKRRPDTQVPSVLAKDRFGHN